MEGQNQERELIQRCKSGDRKAFGELVIKYQERIFATTYRLLGNYEEARDITQDAFINAYQSLKKFKEESSFYTWLYRIAINLCYHKFRSREYQKTSQTQSLNELEEPEEGQALRAVAITKETPRQILIQKETMDTIRKAIATLKKRYYQVVVLRDIEGLSYEEISHLLNCPVGTVMSRLHRARLLLKKKLKGIRTQK